MKRQVILFSFLLIALTAVFSITVANPTSTTLIIQANNIDTATEIVHTYGGQIEEVLAIINSVTASIPEGNVAALQADKRVQAVYENSAADVAGNGAQTTYYPEVMGVDQVWSEGVYGTDITVAVVDTGIDIAEHPRLVGRYDALDNGSPKFDPHGHGTMMASLIGNETQFDGKYLGIAPETNLVDVRVLDANGQGEYSDIIEGLDWILQNKDTYDIRIVNLSLVAGINSPYWADPLDQAVEALWDAGIVVVTAAGNSGPDPLTIAAPGNDPYVITVGSFTDNYTVDDASDDYLTPFSGAGPTETGFVKPDVVAPGAHMPVQVTSGSLWARDHRNLRIFGNYYSIAGTSSSTAATSGVIALMLQQNPTMTPNQVKYALMQAAQPAVYADGSLTWSIFQQGAGRV